MERHESDRAFTPQPVLAVLAKHGVEFVLVGGLAAMAHGSRHPTFDVDVVYARDSGNLERLAAALQELKATLRGAPEDLPFQLDARTLRAGLNFTFSTRYGAFDILGEAAGAPPYAELRNAAESVEIEGQQVQVASLDHLVSMKRAAGRTKDEPFLSEYVALAEEKKKLRK